MPITKKQFEKSIPNFIDKYYRLPYLKEDDIEIKIKNDDGETEIRPYRASRYIIEYYGNEDKMTQELFDKGIITYEYIADVLGLTETLVENAITLETKNPQLEVRRGLHIFFNKDFYEKKLGKYHNKCTGCTKKCKQDYYIGLTCKKYKEKKGNRK